MSSIEIARTLVNSIVAAEASRAAGISIGGDEGDRIEADAADTISAARRAIGAISRTVLFEIVESLPVTAVEDEMGRAVLDTDTLLDWMKKKEARYISRVDAPDPKTAFYTAEGAWQDANAYFAHYVMSVIEVGETSPAARVYLAETILSARPHNVVLA